MDRLSNKTNSFPRHPWSVALPYIPSTQNCNRSPYLSRWKHFLRLSKVRCLHRARIPRVLPSMRAIPWLVKIRGGRRNLHRLEWRWGWWLKSNHGFIERLPSFILFRATGVARASRHLSTKSSVIVLSCFIIISFSRLSSSFPVHLVIIQVKWRNEVSYQEDDSLMDKNKPTAGRTKAIHRRLELSFNLYLLLLFVGQNRASKSLLHITPRISRFLQSFQQIKLLKDNSSRQNPLVIVVFLGWPYAVVK